jgi:hypothetical protein
MPRQRTGIDASGPHVEHQGVRGALLCADRPAPLECGQLGIGPRPDLLALRPLDAYGGIMLQPTLVDCVLYQDTQLLYGVQCSTRTIR